MPPQTEPPKRAIIYARQSKDSEDGIERQVEKCLKLIADRGWELAHDPFCDNDVSASKVGKRGRRPQYELAMGMVTANRIDVLVVAHMDRLYRRAAELETIIPIVEKTGALVVSTDGAYDLSTANGRMVARMLCAASQGEVETKARRNKDANVQAARNGERNKSGCRPFGYCADRFTPMDAGVSLDVVHGDGCPSVDGPGWPSAQPWQEVTVRVPDTVYDHQADGRVVSTQSEADAIRDGIASVNRGGSVTGIERKWHALGFRPPLAPYGPLPDGNPWNHHTVKRILTNPHVAGWRSYRNGEIVAAGNWPAIVGPVAWETAQAILTDPDRRTTAGAVSLLGGIAQCRCGTTVKHAPRKNYGCYRCAAYERGKVAATTGPHVVVKAELIDRYVTDVLIETMELPDAVSMFADDSGQVDIPALKQRVADLDKALAKLSMQNSMDLIPDSIFMVNAAEISAEREAVTAQIAGAGQVNAAAVLVASSDVRATWEGMDVTERRAVVRSVMRVTLKPPGCGCRKPDLDQLVRIAWKTPQRA